MGTAPRVQAVLHGNPTVIPLFVLLVAIAALSVFVGPKFFAPLNLSLILQQVTVVGVLGIAETLVVLTAGIDLSVGAMMVLSAVIMGRLTVRYGVPVEYGVPIGILSGLLCGLFNGMLVSRTKLPPFIATLGSWSIFDSLVTLTSNAETLASTEVEATAPFLQWLGTTIRLGGGVVVTYSSLLMVGIAAAVWFLLHRTSFGRHLHATGDDPLAAELAGINTKRVLLATYALAGVICAIAGWVLIGRIGAVSPHGAQSSNLDAITAVVIGGTSLFGGRGSIMGTLFGALIVGVFHNGLALAGVRVLWQEFAVGALIIVAVIVDQWIRRLSS